MPDPISSPYVVNPPSGPIHGVLQPVPEPSKVQAGQTEEIHEIAVEGEGAPRNVEKGGGGIEIVVDEPKVEEPPATLTARLKEMIVNASERHVTSLRLSDVRAMMAPIRKAIEDAMQRLDTKSNRYGELSQLLGGLGKDLYALCSAAENSFAKLAQMNGKTIAQAVGMGKFSCSPGESKYIYDFDEKYDLAKNPGPFEGNVDIKVVKSVGCGLAQAMTDQMKLADLLEDLYRKTDCSCDGLYELAAASRARELEMFDMATGLGLLARQKNGDDKGTFVNEAMFGMTASRLLAHFAADMHGNDSAFDLLAKELAPIAEDLEALKQRVATGRKDLFDATAFAALRQEIDEAVKVLRQAADGGIKLHKDDSSRFIPEASVLRAAEKHLAQLSADLTALESTAVVRAAESMAEEILPEVSELFLMMDERFGLFNVYFGSGSNAKTKHEIEAASDKFKRSLKTLDEFGQSLKTACRDRVGGKIKSLKDWRTRFDKEYMSMSAVPTFAFVLFQTAEHIRLNCPDEKAGNGVSINLATKLREEKNKKLLDEILKMSGQGVFAPFIDLASGGESADGQTVTYLGRKLAYAEKRLGAMQKMKSTDFAVDDPLLLGLFRGDYTAATYIGAKAWEMPVEALDPTIDDGALVSSEPLGSGGINTVYLCTYRMPDGSERKYVFKPEMSARLGLDMARAGGTFTDEQKAASMNFAAKELATFLGTPQQMPDVHVGVHGGKFGLFMSVAPGVEGRIMSMNIGKEGLDKADPGILTALNEFKKNKLSRDGLDYLTSLVREISALEWNDLISGQPDRHWDNYKISVDETTHSFGVTGIDNDISFPAWRLGVFKFRARGKHAKSLKTLLVKCGAVTEERLENAKKGETIPLERELSKVNLNCDGTDDFVLDLTPSDKKVELDRNLNSFAISLCKDVFGMQKMAVPRFISAEMHAQMQKLSKMTDQQIRDVLKTDLTDEQIMALRARTEDALHYAEILAEDGREIAADDWMKEENRRNVVWNKICKDSSVSAGRKRYEFQYLCGPFIGDLFSVNKFFFLP